MGIQHIGRRSCGTCRDRRVLCDRTAPICLQCSQSNRPCKGYGIRLSWPTKSSSRRAIVAKPAHHHSRARLGSNAYLIHVSYWDVQMHHRLTDSSLNGQAQQILPVPMSWNPAVLEMKDSDLLEYFQYEASQALTSFSQDPVQLGHVLMRIALSNKTPSASAVLKSILALSSLHKYGIQDHALKLKISSIRALGAASRTKLGPKEIIQHIAAGMLLCSFEVHQSSCTTSQWTWYISGVKDILNSSSVQKFHGDSDLAALVDWVHYHDVLGSFSLRHWRDDAKTPLPWPETGFTDVQMQAMSVTTTFAPYHNGVYTSPMALLILLSEICAVVPACCEIHDLSSYKEYLKVLEWRIRSIPVPVNDENASDAGDTIELYRLSLLVYLGRISERILGPQTKSEGHIDTAFEIFSRIPSCERQFPLFVLGCEARTDERRLIVLDLISRTESKVSSRSLNHVKILVQTIWSQDDLSDGGLDYWDKLSSIISACAIVPSFV